MSSLSSTCPGEFSNVSCTAWTENHHVALKVIRGSFMSASTILSIYYISHCIVIFRLRNLESVSQQQVLRHRIVYCLAGGYICLAIYYALGNCLEYRMESTLGIACNIAVVIAVILIFTASVLFFVIIQEIYLASCGSQVAKLAAKGYRAVHVIISPLVIFYCIVLVLSMFGIIPTGIDFSRMLYVASLPCTIVFGVQSVRYGKPVVAAIENAANTGISQTSHAKGSIASSDGDVSKNLMEKAKVFRANMYGTVGGCVVNSSIYFVVGFTRVMHNPTVFIIVQTQLTLPLVFGGLLIAPIFGVPKLMCNNQALVHPTTGSRRLITGAISSTGTLTSGL